MTAVVAEGPGESPPDLWADLRETVDRAGGRPDRLWVDDSKRVYTSGKGVGRLEAGSLACIASVAGAIPGDLEGLLGALGAGSLAKIELSPWLESGPCPAVPHPDRHAAVQESLRARPLEGAAWRIVSVRSVVVGPARFNARLDARGSKAAAHFDAFASLLSRVWDDHPRVSVRGDKHGGRHFYHGPLVEAFPGCWIDRGPEGPSLSRYTLRDDTRRLDLSLQPEADRGDGLVALASMVSKYLRERWMEAFNAHCIALVPGLRPTAGYPVDAARFRAAIEPVFRERGLDPRLWWRAK
jgi:hypothetical protein